MAKVKQIYNNFNKYQKKIKQIKATYTQQSALYIFLKADKPFQKNPE